MINYNFFYQHRGEVVEDALEVAAHPPPQVHDPVQHPQRAQPQLRAWVWVCLGGGVRMNRCARAFDRAGGRQWGKECSVGRRNACVVLV